MFAKQIPAAESGEYSTGTVNFPLLQSAYEKVCGIVVGQQEADIKTADTSFQQCLYGRFLLIGSIFVF